MSTVTTTGGPDGEKTCRECNTVLIPKENWSIGNIKTLTMICKECDSIKKGKRTYQKRRTPETEASRIERKKKRILDEERIDRMTEWIQDYNLQYHIDKYIINFVEQHKNDPNVAREKAIKETKNWTYDTIKDKRRPDREVMAEVLLRHGITRPKEGDTNATWHIAFHECGYNGYELDEYGLPLSRPGQLTYGSFTLKRKRADIEYSGRDGRIGIVSVPYLDVERQRPKIEYRLIICEDEDIYKILDDKRRLRHSRENDKMAKLRKAMEKSTTEKQDIVDALVGILNRT